MIVTKRQKWRKAARGGASGKRFQWETVTISHAQANFRNNGGRTYATGGTDIHPSCRAGAFPLTSPVGSFGENTYGLSDMAGNVKEWCWDWYGPSFYSTTNGTTDPRGPISGTSRVLRGGSWFHLAIYARCAARGRNLPGTAPKYHGFRPARKSTPHPAPCPAIPPPLSPPFSRVRTTVGLLPEHGYRLAPVYGYGYQLESLEFPTQNTPAQQV